MGQNSPMQSRVRSTETAITLRKFYIDTSERQLE